MTIMVTIDIDEAIIFMVGRLVLFMGCDTGSL